MQTERVLPSLLSQFPAPQPEAPQQIDLLHFVFFIALGVILLLALALLLVEPEKAQRIVRWIKRLMFGGDGDE